MSFSKSLVLLLCLGFVMPSCSKEPGQLNATLDLSGLTNAADIARYVLIVQQSGTAAKPVQLLFPSDCVACVDGGTQCLESTAANFCIRAKTCGFDASALAFDARIKFDKFAEDSNIELLICGLESDGAVVASGSSFIQNVANQTANVVMTAAVTPCENSFRQICP